MYPDLICSLDLDNSSVDSGDSAYCLRKQSPIGTIDVICSFWDTTASKDIDKYASAHNCYEHIGQLIYLPDMFYGLLALGIEPKTFQGGTIHCYRFLPDFESNFRV